MAPVILVLGWAVISLDGCCFFDITCGVAGRVMERAFVVRLSAEELARVDVACGGVSRSRWVRGVLAAAVSEFERSRPSGPLPGQVSIDEVVEPARRVTRLMYGGG